MEMNEYEIPLQKHSNTTE